MIAFLLWTLFTIVCLYTLFRALWMMGVFGRFIVVVILGSCVVSPFISYGCLPAEYYGYGYPYPEFIQDRIDYFGVDPKEIPLEPEAQRRWSEQWIRESDAKRDQEEAGQKERGLRNLARSNAYSLMEGMNVKRALEGKPMMDIDDDVFELMVEQELHRIRARSAD